VTAMRGAGRRDDPTRAELGYGASPGVPWRGWLDPLAVIAYTLVGLTGLTAVLIEFPFGFWTYLVSLGSVALVWLLMVLTVGRRPGGGR